MSSSDSTYIIKSLWELNEWINFKHLELYLEHNKHLISCPYFILEFSLSPSLVPLPVPWMWLTQNLPFYLFLSTNFFFFRYVIISMGRIEWEGLWALCWPWFSSWAPAILLGPTRYSLGCLDNTKINTPRFQLIISGKHFLWCPPDFSVQMVNESFIIFYLYPFHFQSNPLILAFLSPYLGCSNCFKFLLPAHHPQLIIGYTKNVPGFFYWGNVKTSLLSNI